MEKGTLDSHLEMGKDCEVAMANKVHAIVSFAKGQISPHNSDHFLAYFQGPPIILYNGLEFHQSLTPRNNIKL